MKVAILASLLAGAAAFAPVALKATSSTALKVHCHAFHIASSLWWISQTLTLPLSPLFLYFYR
jgi:hypothetical protein